MKYISDMTNNQLIAFIKLHTLYEYADQRIGTNPVSGEEIQFAKYLLRGRNRLAFNKDVEACDEQAERKLEQQELKFNSEF